MYYLLVFKIDLVKMLRVMFYFSSCIIQLIFFFLIYLTTLMICTDFRFAFVETVIGSLRSSYAYVIYL